MSSLTENIPIARPAQNNDGADHLPVATDVVRVDQDEQRQHELESRQKDKITALERKLKQQELEHKRLVNTLEDTNGRKNKKITNLQNIMKRLRATIELQKSMIQVKSEEHDQSKEHLDTHLKESDELNIGLEKQVWDLTETVNALRRKIKKHTTSHVSLQRTRAELRTTNKRLQDANDRLHAAYAELKTADGLVKRVSEAIKVWHT